MSNAVQVLAEKTAPDFGLSAEEFFELYAGKQAELIDGEVRKLMPTGAAHGFIAINIAVVLKAWAKARRAGHVYVETGFILQRGPDIVRAPDVSLINNAQPLQASFLEGAPLLAVEIVSPNDRRQEVEVEDKIALYLAHEVASVWVVRPEAQTVAIHAVEQAPRVFCLGDTLRDDAVLPGFEMPVREVFEG